MHQQSNFQSTNYSAFEVSLNQLNGSEVFQIFNNEQNYLQLIRISKNFPDTMNRFIWRLKYILGEIFLFIQKQLNQRALLPDSLKLDDEDTSEIVACIIQRGKMVNQSKEFQTFKKIFEKIFNNLNYEEKQLLLAYGFCMRIWKPSIAFELNFPGKQKTEKANLSEEIQGNINLANSKQNRKALPLSPKGPPNIALTKVQAQRTSSKAEKQAASFPNEPDHRQTYKTSGYRSQFDDNSNRQTQRPEQQLRNSKIQKYQSLLNQLNGQNNRQSMKATSSFGKAQEDTIRLNNEMEESRLNKGLNRNWNKEQEEYFCKIYLQYDSPEEIRAQMQKKFGQDSRWIFPKQIQSKMSALINKIFRKFSGLDTCNPNILKFRTLRSFVLSSDKISQKDRQILSRLFAIIYESMLNVNSSKRTIISQKIIEVVSLCQKIEQSE